MNTNPRNVLVLMADQLAAGWLPVYGFEGVRAPRLTELASDAAVFDAAYCPFPLCAPSRGAMLAGRFASRIGVYDNAAEMPATVPTAVHHLRAAGYQTMLSGKMHFVGPDQLHGFERRLTTDIYPASADWVPDWERALADRLPWYHTMESVLTPDRCVASMQTDYDDEVCFQAVRAVRDMARSADERPFLMVASFTNPHDPWEIPGRYWDLYSPDSIELPSVPAREDLLDPHSRRLRAMCGADQVELSDEQIRRARHGYFAAISYLDERIGEILDALRAVGLLDSTWIVLTADHGEFLGERGLWYKMSFLDPSARVPLIVRPPGGLGSARRVADPVSLLDLAPTLLSLAGMPDDALRGADMDGTSLAPVLNGGAWEPRPVICEYHAEGVTAPAAMIRDGEFKLIVCETDPDQLYDLTGDPLELTNLAADPSYADVIARLRAALESRLDLDAIGARVLASQRDRRLVERGLAQGRRTAWDYEPRVDASMQYVRARSDLYELQRRARLQSPGSPGSGA